MNNVHKIVANLTLEEKASLCSGHGMWHTKEIKREIISGFYRIPSIMVSDGPSGLRKQNLSDSNSNINNSIVAVCFPSACLTACSFDRELLYLEGETLGEECIAEDVAILLGPGVNIKRSPLCGRNFEYFSEDSYLAGQMGLSWIQGVQSQNIGTSLKHFAVNSQEYRRMSSSSDLDERTLREIYLPAFEIAVKQGNPDSVMCSYNKVNGVYASENEYLLTKILRDEWEYKGLTVSDWGAVSDRVASIKAGLDLEMPGSQSGNDERIISAVKSGDLDVSLLDRSIEKILSVIIKYISGRSGGDTNSGVLPENCNNFDYKAHHKLAVKIAQESIVLLKNVKIDTNKSLLPLDKKDCDKILVVGNFAQNPRYQGGGSAHVNTNTVVSFLDAIKQSGLSINYIQIEQAINIEKNCILDSFLNEVKKAKNVVVFAGLPDSYESEGFDRTHMKLPEKQNMLIEAIASVQARTVVVLQNGAPVEMPWVNKIPAILESYLGGEGVGEAVFNLLFGDANPCGKLAETFPVKLEDTPSYLNFANDTEHVNYSEGIFVGYRWYEAKNIPVLFPFGHGLSYTSFKYSDINLNVENSNISHDTVQKIENGEKDTIPLMHDNDILIVTFNVSNTGEITGKEIVQLYVEDCASTAKKDGAAIRPQKELKNFCKLTLKPGEAKLVSFKIEKRALCWYNSEIKDWYAASGKYRIHIGASSKDIRLSKSFSFKTNVILPFKFCRDSVIGNIMNHPIAAKIFEPYLQKLVAAQNFDYSSENKQASEAITADMIKAMMVNNPLRAIVSFSAMTNKELDDIILELNTKLDKVRNNI